MEELNALLQEEISGRIWRLLDDPRNRLIKIGIELYARPNGKLEVRYYVTASERRILRINVIEVGLELGE